MSKHVDEYIAGTLNDLLLWIYANEHPDGAKTVKRIKNEIERRRNEIVDKYSGKT